MCVRSFAYQHSKAVLPRRELLLKGLHERSDRLKVRQIELHGFDWMKGIRVLGGNPFRSLGLGLTGPPRAHHLTQ